MKDLELNSYVIQDISSCLRMLKPYGIMYESPSVYFPNISRVDKVNFQVWKDYLAFDITIAKTNFLINVPIKSTVSLNDNNIDFQFPNGDFLVIGLDKEIETLKNGLNIFNRKDIFKESLKESFVRVVTFQQIVDSRFDDISEGEEILNDRKDEIVELCGNDFSVYTTDRHFVEFDDDTQWRETYYVRKNNNKITWDDLYKIVNSVKPCRYKFDKINDSHFESKKSSRKSLKESRKIGYIRKTEYEINGNNYSISDNGKLFKIIDDLDSKGFTFKYESEWISKDICKHFLAEDDEMKVDLYK